MRISQTQGVIQISQTRRVSVPKALADRGLAEKAAPRVVGGRLLEAVAQRLGRRVQRTPGEGPDGSPPCPPGRSTAASSWCEARPANQPDSDPRATRPWSSSSIRRRRTICACSLRGSRKRFAKHRTGASASHPAVKLSTNCSQTSLRHELANFIFLTPTSGVHLFWDQIFAAHNVHDVQHDRAGGPCVQTSMAASFTSLQRTATHCNTLQRTATHCNI